MGPLGVVGAGAVGLLVLVTRHRFGGASLDENTARLDDAYRFGVVGAAALPSLPPPQAWPPGHRGPGRGTLLGGLTWGHRTHGEAMPVFQTVVVGADASPTAEEA